MGEEKGGKRGVQESACEDNGDSIKKYKDCDMIRFALQKADLYAGMKDGTKQEIMHQKTVQKLKLEIY